MSWINDLFINNRFMKRGEFNNIVGAAACDAMNNNVLQTVIVYKINTHDGAESYDQEPQILLFKENILRNMKRQGFPDTNLIYKNTVPKNLVLWTCGPFQGDAPNN